MPAVAVAGAVWGAVEIGTVGLAAMSGFQALAAVGAVVSGIGALTGESELTKIGGVMGLVGGVGAIANSESLWHIGDSAHPVDSAASDAAASSWEEGAARATEAGASSATAQAAAPVVDTGTPDISKVVDAPKPGLIDSPPAADAAKGTAAADVADPSKIGKLSYGDDMMGVQPDVEYGGSSTYGSGKAPDVSVYKTLTDNAKALSEWANKNQLLASGIMQVGGKFMSGLFDPTKEAQIRALNARAQTEQVQTGLLNQQLSNMQAPLPTPVQGTQRPVTPFLSSVRPSYTPPKINVTGVPA